MPDVVDLSILWSTVRRSWVALVALVALGLAGGALVGWLTETTYSSRSSMLVTANQATSTSELYTASVLAIQRTPAYVEALQGSEVAESVSTTIDGVRSPSELEDHVGVAVGPSGNTVTLTVSDSDAELSATIASAYQAEAIALIEDRERAKGMALPALVVDVIEEPQVPTQPARPDWNLLLILGTLAGALVSGTVAVLRATHLARQRENAEPAG